MNHERNRQTGLLRQYRAMYYSAARGNNSFQWNTSNRNSNQSPVVTLGDCYKIITGM